MQNYFRKVNPPPIPSRLPDAASAGSTIPPAATLPQSPQPAAIAAAPAQENTPMSFLSKILSSIGHFFVGFFTTILGSDAAKTVEEAIIAFIKTDVGKLALDAVNYASTLPPGTSNDALRAAAVEKLKADLTAAGKDLKTIGTSSLNLFIEMAFTYVSGTISKIPTTAPTATPSAPAPTA
jgi:hypothetical protein